MIFDEDSVGGTKSEHGSKKDFSLVYVPPITSSNNLLTLNP